MEPEEVKDDKGSHSSVEELHLKGKIVKAGSIVTKRKAGGATSRILMGDYDSEEEEHQE